MLLMNLWTHAPTLKQCQRLPFDSNSSNTSDSVPFTAKANACLVAFASASDSGIAVVTISGGQLAGSFS